MGWMSKWRADIYANSVRSRASVRFLFSVSTFAQIVYSSEIGLVLKLKKSFCVPEYAKWTLFPKKTLVLIIK